MSLIAIEWHNDEKNFRLQWSPFKHLHKNKNTATLTITTKTETLNTPISRKDFTKCNPSGYLKPRLSKKVEAELASLRSSPIKAFLFSGSLRRLDGLHTIFTSYEDHLGDFHKFFNCIDDRLIKMKNNKEGYKKKYPKNTVSGKSLLIKTDPFITHSSAPSGYALQKDSDAPYGYGRQAASDPFERRYNHLLA